MARKYPLDDDIGGRHLFFGDPSGEYLCRYTVCLEKVLFGIRADYDCGTVHRDCSEFVDALACLGLQQPVDEFFRTSMPLILFFVVSFNLSAFVFFQEDSSIFPHLPFGLKTSLKHPHGVFSVGVFCSLECSSLLVFKKGVVFLRIFLRFIIGVDGIFFHDRVGVKGDDKKRQSQSDKRENKHGKGEKLIFQPQKSYRE